MERASESRGGKPAAARSRGKRLRRAADRGYARGDETRRRIVEAATRLFGERGFEGASTRDIAAAANVNAPALQYYFDNKEGVYAACVESIIDDVRAAFVPAMRRARSALRGRAPTGDLVRAFLDIHAVMLECVLQPEAAERRLFVAREFAGEESTMASELMQRRLRRPLSGLTLGLLARICRRPATDPVLRIRLLSLKGQAMPINHSRRLALESLGWTRIDPPKAALLKATLLEQTRVLLEHWAREKPAC